MGPLDGITVVSLEQAVAAPFATRQLADLGARVIKIERPGGGDFARRYDADRARPVQLLRLAQPLQGVADARRQARPPGSEILHELLAGADVFVQNLGPGAAARLGLDAEPAVRPLPEADRTARSPATAPAARGPTARPTTCSCSARPGWCRSPAPRTTRRKVGISVADIAAGMYAYSGILTALLRRATTGSGARGRGVAVRGARRVDGPARLLHPLRRQPAGADRRRSTPRSPRTAPTPPPTARPWCSPSRTSASGPRCAGCVLGDRDAGRRPAVRHRLRPRAATATSSTR